MKKIILRTLAALLLVLIVLVVNTIWFKPFFIRAFYEKVFAQVAFDSPELLSQLRLVEGVGIQGHNRKLDDASEAKSTQQLARLRDDLATLHRYDTTGMRGAGPPQLPGARLVHDQRGGWRGFPLRQLPR